MPSATQEVPSLALICLRDHELHPHALPFAARLLAANDLQPVLLHVRRPKTEAALSEEVLAAGRAALALPQVESLSRVGTPLNEVLSELKQRDYALLVLGTSKRPTNLPASPLSKELALRAPCSVLLIRNPPPALERILLCTGGHEGSLPVISQGIHLAQATGAQLTILHVVSTPPAMYTGLPAIEENLAQVLQRETPLAVHLKGAASRAKHAGVPAEIELRHGMVTEEIVRACEVHQQDLIVLGAPRPGALADRLLLGRVAPRLLASATKSTFIVRTTPGNRG